MEVEEIRTYPLRSAKGIPRSFAHVLPWGLEGDRRWGVVGPLGELIWVGEHPRLLSVSAVEIPEGGLHLSAKDMGELKVPPATGELLPLRCSNLDRAVLAHADAHEWFTRLLGRPARLVWLDDPGRRTVTEKQGGLWDGPLLLVSRSSLRRLDDWIAEAAVEHREQPPAPLDVARFRPNVVIDGEDPFAEDVWTSVRIGEVDFRVSTLCDRCVVTIWDPVTQERGKEPLRTLAKRRRWDGHTWFGIRLVPRNVGELRVGDEVRPG
ncbi:MOSC domain-containing protein [Streptosporangium sp. NPDC023615]|uniref:MOSC domain-containing protein n=1 Tax=Streptosporangium sp. NPDC023615 TaxID=3154794 RepID=UPI00343ADF9F